MLVAELQGLAAQDLDGLTDAARAERLLAWRGLLDRQEGLWLGELAAVDARGAAGAEEGIQVGSTAEWLRARLHMGAGTAASLVRTARALFGGPLTETAQALTAGELSPAHGRDSLLHPGPPCRRPSTSGSARTRPGCGPASSARSRTAASWPSAAAGPSPRSTATTTFPPTRAGPRPAYQQLLADIEGGLVDAVIVWALDRLHRRPAELERFFEVCDRAGVTRLASVAGDVDLGTNDDRFHARILGAVAKKENDDRRRRIQRAALQAAEQGRVAGGGTRPFGYTADRLRLVDTEAELIREAVARVLAGESLRSIAADWNTRQVRTPTGGRWRTQVLRRMLLSARIAGLREHHGVVTAAAVWPGIIDRDTHERLRAILTDPGRQKFNGIDARRYLLTGFLVCGCGRKLVARPCQARRRRSVCVGPNFGGCGKTGRLADPVEQLVLVDAFADGTPEPGRLRPGQGAGRGAHGHDPAAPGGSGSYADADGPAGGAAGAARGLGEPRAELAPRGPGGARRSTSPGSSAVTPPERHG